MVSDLLDDMLDAPTPHWAQSTWLDDATNWIDGRLREAGRRRIGPVADLRVRPWSATFSVPTEQGACWLKACAPDTRFEVGIYRILSVAVPEQILLPLAVDRDRGWLLLPDGGRAIGGLFDNSEAAKSARRADQLSQALRQYGALQRAVAPRVDDLLAAGVADMRPAVMPARFDEAVERTRNVLRPADIDERQQLAAVEKLRGRFADWSAELAESTLPASLDHNDLHVENVLPGQGPYRFFDWGDAVVAHPFACLLVPLSILATLRGVTTGDPSVQASRSEYLAGFASDPAASLSRAADLAVRAAVVARALVWDRAIAMQRTAGEQVDPDWVTAPLESLSRLLTFAEQPSRG